MLCIILLRSAGKRAVRRCFSHIQHRQLGAISVNGCAEKTIFLAIPVISSIFEGPPNEALYPLSILIRHPTQLEVGSMIVPRLAKFVEQLRQE